MEFGKALTAKLAMSILGNQSSLCKYFL